MAGVKVGIIGGSGLGDALCARVKGQGAEVSTPFGSTSGPITEAEWSGTPVAVLNRHGAGHQKEFVDVQNKNIQCVQLFVDTHRSQLRRMAGPHPPAENQA